MTGDSENMMGGMMGMMGMMGGTIIWAVLVLLLLAAIAYATIVIAVRTPRDGPSQQKVQPAGADDARTLVRRRFASGEIDDEEYHRLLASLDKP